MSVSVLFLSGLSILSSAVAADQKPFVPSTKYATTRVVGWTVRVHRELLTSQSDLGSNAIALLAVKLREITNTVPARACEALKRVPIWLGVNDGHAPCAEYHPSKSWLAANGYNPDKAKCVEIGNARKFIEWSPTHEQALEWMIYFHDRYALDGRDPNTYANILWCFGLHDRPWFERPIFGTVRYMSLEGMKRKTDTAAYIREIDELQKARS